MFTGVDGLIGGIAVLAYVIICPFYLCLVKKPSWLAIAVIALPMVTVIGCLATMRD